MSKIQELKALMAKATWQGPWRSDCILPPEHMTRLHMIRSADDPPTHIIAEKLYEQDGIFIAATLNALPDLIAAVEALKEISKGAGEFDIDPFEHAKNCIHDMKSIARAALAKLGE